MHTKVFININIFDGKHNTIYEDSWLLINKDTGKIIKLGSGNIPSADETIDLKDKYIMPGLINAHTHVTLNPYSHDGDGFADIVDITVRSVEHLKELLKSGVTYIRGCGSSYGIDRNLAKLKENGKLKESPWIMPSGAPMTMSGGHGILFHGGNVVDSEDEMRKGVRKNFANGAQCIKVMATGGVMSINDNMNQPQLNVKEMKVAVEEAHNKATIVAAHAEANPGIMNAIEAGVDSIEHGDYVNEKEIALMIKKEIYLTPTLSIVKSVNDHKHELPKWEVDKNLKCMKAGFKNFKKAYDEGVKFTLGTDAGCPYAYFDATPTELELLVDKIGMSNFDALSTSRHSAELMKLNEYGTLEENKYADFLVLKSNPLEDVKSVKQLDKSVYQHGQCIF